MGRAGLLFGSALCLGAAAAAHFPLDTPDTYSWPTDNYTFFRQDLIRQAEPDGFHWRWACTAWSECPCHDTYKLLENAASGPARSNDTSGPDDEPHKRLWPISSRDVLTWLLAVVTLFFAAGGGIGGGGVLVPLYIIVLNFQTEFAVALSNLTIAGGALANLYCNYPRRHPSAERPLIDWDMILVMEPMTIVGAVLGGYLNKVLPAWLVNLLLCVLLWVMAHKMWGKSARMWVKETQHQLLAERQQSELSAMETGSGEAYDAEGSPVSLAAAVEPLLVTDSNKALVDEIMAYEHPPGVAGSQSGGDVSSNGRVLVRAAEAKAMLVADSRQLPREKIVPIALLFAWLLVTEWGKLQVQCASPLYWLIVLSVVPAVAAIMVPVRRQLVWKEQLLEEVGLTGGEGDVEWTQRTTILYPLWCSCAGVVAGMFGVGGGIVKAPLMLYMGVLPEVAAASSATMILFTSSSASAVYIAFGDVKWDYGGVLFVTGFVATLLGQMLTYLLISRCGRRSVIVIAMAVLLTAGAVFMVHQTWVEVEHARDSGYFAISDICTAYGA